MFQEFPYTNFHQLNLDWIVKIAKDFLDQYTHIQEVIQTGLDDLAESRETGLDDLAASRAAGLEELNQKTLDGLADLQEKYDTLNGLLQSWYDTHSADIAGQLADAIADFNAAAEAKSQALLDSWPADYSELVTEYNNLKSALNLFEHTELPGVLQGVMLLGDTVDFSTVTVGQYIKYDGSVITTGADDFDTTASFNLKNGQTLSVWGRGSGTTLSVISKYDSSTETYTCLVRSISNTWRKYVYTTDEDIQVVISYNHRFPVYAFITGKIVEIMEETKLYNSINLNNIVKGSFINKDGAVGSNNSFSMTNPFDVIKGQKIIIKAAGWGSNVSMIAKYDPSAGTYTPLVICTGSNVDTYSCIAEADEKIVLSFDNTQSYDASVYMDLEKEGERITRNADVLMISDLDFAGVDSGHYINASGNYNTNADFSMTNPFDVKKGQKIIFTAAGSNANVAIIAEYDPFLQKYIPLVNSINSSVNEYTYTPTKDMKIVLSYNHTKTYHATTQLDVSIFTPEPVNVDLSLFERIGVVGDSFASGELYYNSSYHDHYNISWGQIMARKHGITCTNYSRGGMTTRSWLTNEKGLQRLLASDPDGLYFLVLGINDASSLGIDYLGQESDIKQDYTQNEDTFWGNYGKIISNIQLHAPHAKIILSTMADNTSPYSDFNTAIIGIANHFSLPYIVQANDSFFTSSFYLNNMVGSHPVGVTYSGMALAIDRLATKCIHDNMTYFKTYDAYD